MSCAVVYCAGMLCCLLQAVSLPVPTGCMIVDSVAGCVCSINTMYCLLDPATLPTADHAATAAAQRNQRRPFCPPKSKTFTAGISECISLSLCVCVCVSSSVVYRFSWSFISVAVNERILMALCVQHLL